MLITKPRLPLKEIILHGWLPSPLKKILYRLKGYRIGRGVSLGLGSVVLGREVEIGDHARIGFLTVVRGNTLRIGAHVQIGAMSILDTPHLELGEGTKINEQVFVGGLQFPDSRLVVGRNCQIMQMTFINPARSIVIGDDTGIGGDCLIFGHTSWLSRFEGYPVDFQSIEIGNSVSIAWRVFLVPGVKIGDGVVVGANSLVTHSLPPRCLAVGFPARVVAKSPYFPRTVSDAEKESMLKEIVAEMLGYFEGSGLKCGVAGPVISVTQRRQRWFGSSRNTWRLVVAYDATSSEQARPICQDIHVFVSLRRLPDDTRAFLSGQGVMWIDIEQKERSDADNELGEETAMYLRRYGVRLLRVPPAGAATNHAVAAGRLADKAAGADL
jgi:acetyltransferase-like isoleucine patch superfamily enzyme